MFNPFRKKPKFDDAAKQVLADALAGLLEIQRACAGGRNIECQNGQINRKAIGYIYGFVDASLTLIGQDAANAAISVPIIWQVFHRLSPGKEEKYVEFLAEYMGRDEVVTLGAMTGGQQYIDFVAKKRQDGGVAMGFARYLIEGDGQQE